MGFKEDFKKDASQWLAPFGYTLHSSSMEDRFLVFTSPDHFATIDCYLHVNQSLCCRLVDNSYKLTLKLDSGEIAFMHPDIKKYIEVFDYYGAMAERYPPF